DRFRGELPVPLLHIVEATVGAAAAKSPEGSWLLSTSATRESRIYPRYARENGCRFLEPSDAQQGRAQESLTLVKANRIPEAGKVLRGLIEELWEGESLPVVTACTELPLAYAASGLPADREISSLEALSKACLDFLYN
ncbi:MAG: aspartate/glutamate racemase family protein, partial [Synergistaceae bacterium]|nr:aspartate/glutamate racemase family protein [Synergistaceae bacterium]